MGRVKRKNSENVGSVSKEPSIMTLRSAINHQSKAIVEENIQKTTRERVTKEKAKSVGSVSKKHMTLRSTTNRLSIVRENIPEKFGNDISKQNKHFSSSLKIKANSISNNTVKSMDSSKSTNSSCLLNITIFDNDTKEITDTTVIGNKSEKTQTAPPKVTTLNTQDDDVQFLDLICIKNKPIEIITISDDSDEEIASHKDECTQKQETLSCNLDSYVNGQQKMFLNSFHNLPLKPTFLGTISQPHTSSSTITSQSHQESYISENVPRLTEKTFSSFDFRKKIINQGNQNKRENYNSFWSHKNNVSKDEHKFQLKPVIPFPQLHTSSSTITSQTSAPILDPFSFSQPHTSSSTITSQTSAPILDTFSFSQPCTSSSTITSQTDILRPSRENFSLTNRFMVGGGCGGGQRTGMFRGGNTRKRTRLNCRPEVLSRGPQYSTFIQPYKSSNIEKTNRKLRPIIIDGLNIAHAHGFGTFSIKGIDICIKYFADRGHKEIIAFIPQHRKALPGSESILNALAKKGHICYTPSRKIQNVRMTCFDDRIILNYAKKCGGVVVSNDNFRDLYEENEEFKEIIERRQVMVSFVKDDIIVPDDQYNGKNYYFSLSDVLCFPE